MTGRIIRGVGSLLVLAGTLVGLPWALLLVGAPAVPGGGVQGLWHALVTPDMTGDLLVLLVTLIGWLSWAGFAICVVSEAINLGTHHKVRIRLPGLATGQHAASGLLVAVAAMMAVAIPTVGTASTAQAAPGPSVTAPAQSGDSGQGSAGQEAAPQHHSRSATTVHTVKKGEYLWSIAERYYGDGAQFRRIAEANNINPFADLAVNQQLLIPQVPQTPPQAQSHRTVTVGPKDSLSSFAQTYLGDADRWPEIYRLNRAVIGSDPDLILDGTVLRLPSTATTPTTKAPASTPPTPHHQEHGHTPDDAEVNVPAPTPLTTPSPGADRTASALPSSPPRPAPTTSTAPSQVGQNSAEEVSRFVMPGIYASVGLLLTAGVVTSVNWRRRRQLAERKRGQRIPSPSEPAQRTETVMRAAGAQTVVTISHLDQVLRSIGAWCAQTGLQLPGLTAARVADDRIDLLLTTPSPRCPEGISLAADDSVWTITASDVDTVIDSVEPTAVAAPWPALVTLGRDGAGAHILINLEAAATLHINAEDPADARAIIAAIAMELGMSPWASELNITLAGTVCPGLELALDHPTLTRADDIDNLLALLEDRAADRRAYMADSSAGQKRLDPDLADGWGAEVILTDQLLTEEQDQRLAAILTALPRVGIAAVTTTQAQGDWTFTVGGEPRVGHLEPQNWRITPQLVPQQVYDDTLELLETSATTDTNPAPWWDHDTSTGRPLPDPVSESTPPATITALPTTLTRQPLSLTGLVGDIDLDEFIRSHPETDGPEPTEPTDQIDLDTAVPGPDTPIDLPDSGDSTPDHPMMRILGTPELVGARGPQGRSPRRCQELALYILCHPGRSSAAVADALCLSASTVKSTASHLRSWIGSEEAGTPYFPQAVQGGYRLDDRVSTDWDHLGELLAGQPINAADTPTLVNALALVEGRPLEGAAPGDFAWTQQLVNDIVMTVTDLALELADRALAIRDIALARWALAKALACDPGAEQLMAARAKIEHQAGNMLEVDRIITQINQTSRQLGCDLADETMAVIDQVSNR